MIKISSDFFTYFDGSCFQLFLISSFHGDEKFDSQVWNCDSDGSVVSYLHEEPKTLESLEKRRRQVEAWKRKSDLMIPFWSLLFCKLTLKWISSVIVEGEFQILRRGGISKVQKKEEDGEDQEREAESEETADVVNV